MGTIQGHNIVLTPWTEALQDPTQPLITSEILSLQL